MKLIINADDCGKNKEVNAAISHFIETGKITSTIVMANMDDLEGASRLFDEYQDSISFGIHLNLTEGHPLRYSQELLDRGYYKETANVAGEKGNIYLNINQLRNKIISTSIQKELEKELCAQIEKVLDYGIRISHIDSHHHIHTSLLMLRMMPKLAKRYGIHKMRRMRNYVPSASWTNMALRDLWKQLIKLQNHRIVMTDYFGIYEEWYDNGKQILHENTVLELMCHPGGAYSEEECKLLETDFTQLANVELVNYNMIG